ncbi:MAG: alpha/beta fold hydrolase [Acetobacteraceae bacterium]|nr:alpha/beta fold hydrolase [Acetobacteraceae bacterium]
MTPPWSALEREARVARTACGTGEMVWRVWGDGAPLVLFHGGAGSWRHWLRTIEAFRGERMVVAPDLPGLGESADVPETATDGGASIVAAGLAELLGDTGRADVVGFSFGGAIGGMIAAQHPLRSLTLVGSGGLGVIRRTAKLERVRDKVGAERDAAHRTNLHRWMIADAGRIDDAAVAIQDWNSRHARFDSRAIGGGDVLVRVLPAAQCPVAGIWGEHDHAVQGETERPRAVLQSVQPGSPFVVVPEAGHWVAYEAPDRFAAALRFVLPALVENRTHEAV